MDGCKNQSRRREKIGVNGDAMAEDVGKKRGSDQVHGDDQEYHENNIRALEEGVKRKKVPKATTAPPATAAVRSPPNDFPSAAATSDSKKAPIEKDIRKATSTATKTAANSNATIGGISTSNPSLERPELQSPPPVQVWDVESALMYLVASPSSSENIPSPGTNRVDLNEEEDEREYLTLPPDFDNSTANNQDAATPPSSSSRPWITFRMAHAGDAFMIASWYRRQNAQQDEAKHRRRADQEDKERQRQNSEHGHDEGEEDDDVDDDPELVKTTPIVATHAADHPSENGNQTSPGMRDDGTDLKLETPRRSSSSSSTSSGSPPDNNSTNPSNAANSSLLEHWLAEGLGDEDHCPSVYGLLAYVHREESCRNNHDVGNAKSTYPSQQQEADDHLNALKKQSHVSSTASTTVAAATSSTTTKTLCAVVLLTVAWQGGERSLRIEWMAVGGGDGDDEYDCGGDTDGGVVKLLEPAVVLSTQQKLWLRIAALSVMTACPLIAVDKDVLALMTKCRHENAVRAKEDDNREATKRLQKKDSTTTSTKRVIPSAE